MYRIGVDLGGTNIAAGLVDENYQIVRKKSVPTGADRAPELIVADMAALCRTLCTEANVSLDQVASVGIASPGIADHDTGHVEYANNLPFIHFPIGPMLSEQLGGLPAYIENDANAAALGEAIAGAAKGTKSSVMITLGTGVGGGIIIEGKVYSGFNYAGAELGHIVIEHNGRQCSCGRKGCWEAYSSATALIKMTNEKLEECKARKRKTIMADAPRISGRTAFDAMRAGDQAGKEVVEMYLAYLATGLINIVNIFQPQVVSIGGGVSGEGQWLVDALVERVRAEEYGHGVVPGTKVLLAQLGNDAGIVGAAALGM